MTQTSQPVTKDTPAQDMVKLARSWLEYKDLPAEWENAVALEFEAAITDCGQNFIDTHREGRPADMPVVEWQR